MSLIAQLRCENGAALDRQSAKRLKAMDAPMHVPLKSVALLKALDAAARENDELTSGNLAVDVESPGVCQK
jgi:hypothetical protein